MSLTSASLALMIVFAASTAFASDTPAPAPTPASTMPPSYTPMDFSSLLGMPGFSDTLLQNHFKLYQGYVKNTNLVASKLAVTDPTSPEYAELKRRFGWEFDGMRLHELYFGNLGGKAPLSPDAPLYTAIVAQFGSFDAWQADFTATASMRGIGWVVLYQDTSSGGLFNCWINEHDTGHLAGCTPLLVADVFEHAFLTDYGLDKKSYIAAFWKNVNWDAVTLRYKAGNM